jgi:acetylornithine deacetylase/succinyl-diaminopimelate desuccinylase-like protein
MKAPTLALATLLALAGGTLPAIAAPGPVPPEADRLLARDLFRELIGIDTTHAKGTTLAARAAEARLRAAGFSADEVRFVAPADKPTKGNLVIRIRGQGQGPAVLFLGHLDVVAANAEDWSMDPFQLTERDGHLYGRGTVDMKDGDAALVAALIRLRREGFSPVRDVIVALTADEEAGGDANGPEFLLREHRDLINAGLVLNLDGGGGNLLHGARRYFEVGTSEKTYLTFALETTSPGGHGSLPGPDNAIYRLVRGLARLEAFQFPTVTTATTRAYFEASAQLESGARRADLLAVSRQPPDPAAARRLSESPYFNAQLRTTCVATLISGGHAENALPQRARATIQCRMMPGDRADAVEASLRRALADPAITLTPDVAPIVSPESPPDAKIMGDVGAVVHSMWPDVPLIPTMATGFSDDRQTRNAGMQSYDVSGLWMEGDENRAHGRDERVGAREFDESVEYTYRLVRAFGAKP